MNTNLSLVKSERFGELECDFYQKDDEFYVTRDQIGTALEYSDPAIAIYKIHERHKDRLDKFSVLTKLVSTDGKIYEVYLYSRKGVYEICRWSGQPKADAFFDWVYDVLEKLAKGEFHLRYQDETLQAIMDVYHRDREHMKVTDRAAMFKAIAATARKSKNEVKKKEIKAIPELPNASELLKTLLGNAILLNKFNPRNEKELKSSVLYDDKAYYILPLAVERYLGIRVNKNDIYEEIKLLDGISKRKRFKVGRKSDPYHAWILPRKENNLIMMPNRNSG